MAEEWFVKLENGEVTGPFTEREIATDLLSQQIDDRQQVRQGKDGAWCESARARAVFQQLANAGWYVRSGEEIFGPFTEAKLLDLHRSNDLAPGSEVRQGLTGDWKSADAVLALSQNQKVPVESSSSWRSEDNAQVSMASRNWSVEPIRHVLMALELGSPGATELCAPFERLQLSLPDTPHDGCRLTVQRMNGDEVGTLGEQNSRQIVANSERGLTHVTLFHSSTGPGAAEIALVLCPPGIEASVCRDYVANNVYPK